MKFLLHGNSPTVKTGYGIQLAYLGEMLRADGHDVAFSSTYGIQMSIENWKGMPIYGCGYEINSNDRLPMHADHFFEGEEGWIITCLDVWAMKNPLLAEFNVAAWVPIDHATPLGAPGTIRQFFGLTGALPVPMSKFGAEMLSDLDPTYIPLSVDTSIFRPVRDINAILPRELLLPGVPEEAFVVGMVAMNKGWARDRKGFHEAFRAFGIFAKDHGDAHLVLHSDRHGAAEGIDLISLAVNCGIPEKQIHWSGGPNQYAYYVGYRPELMAALYSSFDVLLAPSHGEGFCVPLIESQACGTPVIATDFSAQSELVGAGWKVTGQSEWDPAHHAFYCCPTVAATLSDAFFVQLDAAAAKLKDAKELRELIAQGRAHNDFGVLDALEAAYEHDRESMKWLAVEFAKQYDTKVVYDKYWKPFIAQISAEPEKPELDREPMPDEGLVVGVLCPAMRAENLPRLVDSFLATTERDGAAHLFLEVPDALFDEAMQFVSEDVTVSGSDLTTCAEKWNSAYITANHYPWVLCIGDDVRFHEGWLDHARKLSGEFDVIGTNDTAGKPKNPKVANGSHADHFFVRRAYVDEYGACLDGPGVLAPEAYRHWYPDMEIVKLAKARGVFSPCLDSVVEHLHPGYLEDRVEAERLRRADPTYMAAVEWAEEDARTFSERLPLIEMQRTGRAKL